jgi:hypothetical protein
MVRLAGGGCSCPAQTLPDENRLAAIARRTAHLLMMRRLLDFMVYPLVLSYFIESCAGFTLGQSPEVRELTDAIRNLSLSSDKIVGISVFPIGH